jgi:hypothetical protein
MALLFAQSQPLHPHRTQMPIQAGRQRPCPLGFHRNALEPPLKQGTAAIVTPIESHAVTQIRHILRHRLAQTTEIYAKVDVAALRALAQPWPGGVA